MNKNQEELERIIKEIRENKCMACEYRYDRNGCIVKQVKNGNRCPKEITDNDIASAILSAGYVKLADVELDEGKITEIIRKELGKEAYGIEVVIAKKIVAKLTEEKNGL